MIPVNLLEDTLFKVDAEIPLSMMCVGNSSEYFLERKFQDAWTEYSKNISKGLVGSVNELWNTKEGAAFVIVEAGHRLHHTTKKTSGCVLFAELGIKLLDSKKGMLLRECMMMSGGPERMDFFLRGSIDITEYGEIDSITFNEVTALCSKLESYAPEMNKIFNKSLLPYASHEMRERFKNKKFPFHKHDEKYDRDEIIEFTGDFEIL